MLSSTSHIGSSQRLAGQQLVALALLIVSVLLTSGCNDLEKQSPEPYYAKTTPPRRQEFRWSNGKLAKSLDPARASVPPETDLIRAVYEGLTELDPATLEPVAAVAERWTASEDFRTWTFQLRGDARWTNGRPVTAEDFVRSWRRLSELGGSVAHHDLLTNIVGFPVKGRETVPPSTELIPDPNANTAQPRTSTPSSDSNAVNSQPNASQPERGPAPSTFGVTAVDARTLTIQLITPDKDLPKLVAHPIFRPVFGDGSEFATAPVSPATVTNGAFRVVAVATDGVALERSENYWNRESVKLERVKFVSAENAEQALEAYKAGDLDAITNAAFEPLALKLLEPYQDFRRRTHAAVNFYEVNHETPPFDDRRVREALAISIERERLTEGEMEGLARPALSFLPFNTAPGSKITQDKERAADLLDEAGFPGGENFPVIRLVVNRNDTQQRVARAVARMWKQNLNIETELIVKENAEVEVARNSGDFDLVRRGVVFPTADELISILAILKPPTPAHVTEDTAAESTVNGVEAEDPRTGTRENSNEDTTATANTPDITMSEANAVYELWAIPLYFPTSYSLVKPYVTGFEMNSLDAPVLHAVSIDSGWQPK